ncbi:MAG: hypothetical protein JSW59_02850 [Phycisphaerales bacterium]|nr:MAG: hypothetical protein JSW59_02850 [Phycisphaerales bacterium]
MMGSEVRQRAKPVANFRAGQISPALWENEITAKNGHKATVLKTSVQRRYKNRNGQWKSSGGFSRNEIPLAIYCLQKAFEKIIEVQVGESGDDGVVEEEVAMQRRWICFF